MGFNKKYLPEIDLLMEIRDQYGDDKEFIKIYLYNPDAIFGSQESIDYIKKIEKNLHEK